MRHTARRVKMALGCTLLAAAAATFAIRRRAIRYE
jgi:hypothetical protein